MEISELSFRSWMLLGLYAIVGFTLAELISCWITPKLIRRFRRKKNVDPPCPMIGCHNTSCDHYLSQYDVCRYSQYPIEDSVLRSLILLYVDVYGVYKLYELISGKAFDQEDPADGN